MFLYWQEDEAAEGEWVNRQGHRGWSYQMMRLISESHFGGGQFSEAHMAASRVKFGDPVSWVNEWRKLGDLVEGWAKAAEEEGRTVTAAARYFRATNYYRTGEFWAPIGESVREEVYDAAVRCFRAGGALNLPRVDPINIPYEDTTLPGYLVRSNSTPPGERSPGVVYFGGADTIAEELFFIARALLERGLHLLLIDGPGQGGALRKQAMTSIPEWERPAGAAFDVLASQEFVDPDAIAIVGMSLGGHHAARAAAYDHRFAACVSWPPQPDCDRFWQVRPDHHPLVPHYLWLMGCDSVPALRERLKDFNVMHEAVYEIACPTLVPIGEGEGSIKIETSREFFDALECPKTWKLFQHSQTGSEHCEMDNLNLGIEYVGDWLQRVLTTGKVPNFEH